MSESNITYNFNPDIHILTTSKQGQLFIASGESLVRSPYFDSAGILTIGIGHTASAGGLDPTTIPLHRRENYKKLLIQYKQDLRKYERRVRRAIKVPLKQHQFDALVSFDFNTGGILTSTLTKRINNKENSWKISKEFLRWNKSGGKINKGLVVRRMKEVSLYLKGNYGDTQTITEYQTNGHGKILWKSGTKIDIARYL